VVPRASRIIWWVQPHSLPRYPPGQDGLPGTEGAFLPCSFWLVQALASTGRADQAAQLFTDLLELANPLGLLPEEINPKNHGYLGNYPQALTHAALIQAALAIRDAHPRPSRPIGSPAPSW
jgi:GH15 family glucan-1,4-alpha-glucosidase